jgi:hypothetical protein
MLTDDSEMLSARAGIPLPSNVATPLPAWLKLPVLSSGARLSPWLGGPVKPKDPARLPKALESPSEISEK